MTQPQAKVQTQDDIEDPVEDAPLNEMGEAQAPTWFSRTYAGATPTHLAEQYRSQRKPEADLDATAIKRHQEAYEMYQRRLDERFSAAQRMADPAHGAAPPPGMAFPQRPNYSRGNQPGADTKPRQKKRGLSSSAMAILTLTACGVGGTGGYVAANPDKARTLMQEGVAFAGSLSFLPTAPATETVISKKSIRTAKLEVKDAAGAINAPIPLDISALPPDDQTPVAVRISGLPIAAYLTKGVEVSQGEWVLSAADIGKAELVVPRTDVPILALQVAALEEKTGAPASPAQDMKVELDLAALPVPGTPQPAKPVPQALATQALPEAPVITPVNAIPDQGFNKVELPAAVPQPLQSLDPEAQALISKGDTLLGSGDVLAARQFYLKAYDKKASAAAFGVGQTYDPAVYSRYKIKGLTPDPTKAAEWYGKAAAEGHVEATAAMGQLTAQ